MAGTKVVVSDVIIDCVDADGLAQFWSELLGLAIRPRQGSIQNADAVGRARGHWRPGRVRRRPKSEVD